MLWLKMYFCKMVGNVMCSRTSHVEATQDIFNLFKGPYPSCHVFTFGNVVINSKLRYGPKCDSAKVRCIRSK